MGSGFSRKKKEAKLFREQFEKMQEKLKEETATGTSGGGLVSITLDGEYEMKKIKINPECVDPEDIEGLEDLVQAAYQDALAKINELTKSDMPDMPGMPDLSGFGF